MITDDNNTPGSKCPEPDLQHHQQALPCASCGAAKGGHKGRKQRFFLSRFARAVEVLSVGWDWGRAAAGGDASACELAR